MKRLLDIIRNTLLIPNPYLTTFQGSFNQPIISNPQEQIRVRYADVQLFAEGVPEFRTFIALSTDRDIPHPVIPNIVECRFFIDIYSDRAYDICEDLFYNQSANTLSTYTYPQGIRTILADRSVPLSVAPDLRVLRFFQIGGPQYQIDEASKLWFMSTLWSAEVVTPAVQLAS
jgi:hypothetical protein